MGVLEKLNHFVYNPTNLDMSRSRFPLAHEHKLTMKSGELVPIYLEEVIAGDTFDMKVSNVTRMITPAVPVMDNAFLDTFFFFVPFRLCTFGEKDFQKIFGENTTSAWVPSSESTLANTGNVFNLSSLVQVKAGSALNHLGFPIMGASALTKDFSTMPLMAYVKIWNEWFRDQNTMAPYTPLNAVALANFLSDKCLKVSKSHDYFTSCMISSQKGNAVILPIGGVAPVSARAESHIHQGDSVASLRFIDFVPTGFTNGIYTGKSQGPEISFNGAYKNLILDTITQGSTGNATVDESIYQPSGSSYPATPTNLYADLASATAASVNEIRQAFAIQRLLEKDARGGSRFREILKAHFGVTIPDLTVQVPEYLAGKRIPLNVTQVLQTADTSNGPLGTTGAFSNSSFYDRSFIKSFNEPGYVVGVACIRTAQSYSQGVHKLWTRNRRYDFYDPTFANLGEMPVYKRELYLQGLTNNNIDEVFGFNEAWAEYRYHPNLVTGYLAPDANDPLLAKWTYTNNFSAVPVLNSSFMEQPSSQIDDTLVMKGGYYQFIVDYYFDVKATRPMPVFSIPGLLDHH